MKHITTLIIFLLLVPLVALAAGRQYTPSQVPDVHKINREWFVSDPDSMLSSSARDRANYRLRALMDSTGVEVAVVVVPGLDGRDIFDFTQEIASSWGVGKRDKNNGLVLLFDMGGRQVRMHTGKGMEGVLPDAACNRIIDEVIIPCLRVGDLDAAVVDVCDKIYDVCTDPVAAAEIRSEAPNDAVDTSELMHLFLRLACCVGAGFYIWLVCKLLWMRRKDGFEKTRILRPLIPTACIFGVLSLGIALPGVLLMVWLSRHYRNKPRRCDVCGTRMDKLPEDEDNKYLTPAQDLEENLKSVDYDVWLCPKCGTTDIFPFDQQSPYQHCPRCHTKAYSQIYDRVETHPSSIRAGRGVRVYACKNCNYRHEAPYIIPKVIVGVIPGGGGRGGGGGGFSGGSWGGGSFGGGGATGRW